MEAEERDLSKLSDEELLALRFCELNLRIEGSWVEKCIAELYRELDEKGIRFHPPCYLADEWLCPDGEPIVGIAFYLAHPRLKSLERKRMLEVEGGDEAWCMRLLRHETGHALNYAYLLHRRKKWKELFGSFSEEYPERYKYRPYSKRYVRHLDEFYAQYHPDEDFAETFAVWLNPKSRWRKRYKGWKALDKLEYVDELMAKIAAKPPLKPEGKPHWDVTRMRTTLRKHYRQKQEFYAEYYPDFHDRHLNRIFQAESADPKRRAYQLIRRYRKRICDQVAAATREKKYIIDGLLKDLIERSRELALYSSAHETDDVLKLTAYVTALTMNYLYTGGFRKES
ncbi:MAG: putative zinc-binding metallopeptidase [Kiritimatiellae bacterium]|nr:putative zinc-binding metallopeptidase [Kiritimatiellia bacterium]